MMAVVSTAGRTIKLRSVSVWVLPSCWLSAVWDQRVFLRLEALVRRNLDPLAPLHVVPSVQGHLYFRSTRVSVL